MPSNKGVTKVKYVWMSRKITTKWNILDNTLPWMHLPGDPGGFKRYEWHFFKFPQAFVTWDSRLTSTQKPFWSHGGAEYLQIMRAFWDPSHPHWFVSYDFDCVRLWLWDVNVDCPKLCVFHKTWTSKICYFDKSVFILLTDPFYGFGT